MGGSLRHGGGRPRQCACGSCRLCCLRVSKAAYRRRLGQHRAWIRQYGERGRVPPPADGAPLPFAEWSRQRLALLTRQWHALRYP